MPNALQVPLKPSKIWLAFLLLMCSLATTSVAYSGFPSLLQLLLILVLSLAAALQIKNWLYPQVKALLHGEDGFALVMRAQGERKSVRILASSRVNPWCSVVRFQTTSNAWMPRRYTLVICPDSSDPQSLRQLRILLNSGLYTYL